MRPSQRGWSARIAASAITGLQVAPTAPHAIAVSSSTGSALSFQSAVGVVCVIVSSGDSLARHRLGCSGHPASPRS